MKSCEYYKAAQDLGFVAGDISEIMHLELWPVARGKSTVISTEVLDADTDQYLIREARRGRPLSDIAKYSDLNSALADIFSRGKLPIWYCGHEFTGRVFDKADLVTRLAVRYSGSAREQRLYLDELVEAAALAQDEITLVTQALQRHVSIGTRDSVFRGAKRIDSEYFEELVFAKWLELHPVSLRGRESSPAEIIGQDTSLYHIRIGLQDGHTRILAVYTDLRKCQKDFFRLKRLFPLYYTGLEDTIRTTDIIDLLRDIMVTRYEATPNMTYFDEVITAAGLSNSETKRLRAELKAEAARIHA